MATLIKFWPVALFVFQLLILWVCWSLRQIAKEEGEKNAAAWRRALDEHVAELRGADKEICEDVQHHESRITRLEEGLKALPQQDDFERLEAEVQQIGRNVAAIAATKEGDRLSISQAQSSVDRLYQYLLTNTRPG